MYILQRRVLNNKISTMNLNHRFAILMTTLLACSSARADTATSDNSWWWDDTWWNEGQIEVPDNYPVESTWDSYPSNGVEVPMLVVRPAGAGKYPAVLFVHGRRGLDDLIQRHARRVAARGFVVLAPDIYLSLIHI